MALHVLLLCLLGVPLVCADCQYWPCTAPCPANHRLLLECFDRSPNTGECFFSGTIKYCDWCPWGSYSAAGNSQPGCEHCPANSIITQGRYSSQFNDNVGNWCEEDCGVAFRNLIQYPIEHSKDFWGELWDPFRWDDATQTGIPCVKYSKKSKLSDCKKAHFEMADNMIVVNPKAYTDSAWLDYKTEVRTTGMQERRCAKCPAGHYIVKDTTKPKFQQRTCQKCPVGMISTDTSCKACSVLEGVPNKEQGACEQCAANHYQFATEQLVEGVKVVMGINCRACPEGYEYHNFVTQSDTAPCRSTDVNGGDCCKPCFPNFYSRGGGSRCEKVDANKGTTRPYTASNANECAVGEELVYCSSAGVCESSRKTGRKIGWRTCRKCSDSNIQRSGSAGVCVACKDDELTGQTDTCVACSSCHEINFETTTQEVYKFEEALRHRLLSLYQTRLYSIEENDFTYTRDVVQARCVPLQRRSLQANILLEADYYRERGQQKQLVPDFYTIIRSNTNCTRLHCADVCRNYFQYSPACGQQEKNVQSMWVVFQNDVVLYKSLTPEQQTAQLYVHHGPCQPCRACTKGAYNGLCNVHVSGNDPAGSCKACLTQCAEGFFMHHPDQEAGCHAPPATHRAANNLWQTSHDYVCRPCPTWVRQDESISVVSACGARQQYTAWVWDENSRLVAQQLPVSFSNWERDLEQLGSAYRNFRGFMRDLKPYCPAGYFYDQQVAGCDLLEQEPESYRVPGTVARSVALGYNAYNPACCRECTTCPFVKKKDTSNWKACGGDTLKDTQDACVDRCGAMYWQNETARECRRCSTCAAGFL